MTKSRRIIRQFMPGEREKWQRLVDQIEEDKQALIAEAQERKASSLARRELQDALKLLDQAREELGLSLADLHERTSIERSNLSRLFNDESANPTLSTVERIANALGMRIVVGLEPNRKFVRKKST